MRQLEEAINYERTPRRMEKILDYAWQIGVGSAGGFLFYNMIMVNDENHLKSEM